MKEDAEEQFLEYCSHIVQWGDRIPGFIKDMTYEQFERDELTHLAVWKCVEVLGEASIRILRLGGDFEIRYPQLPLKQAYAMRNQLTHGYSTIDLGILWTTVQNFVPSMVEEARAILADSGRG
ncbi:HepT-like ribonuclease domain-containing protein [Allomesorhizobium camelthorni]|uniref:DUF86 domain-containing protein n=1 Tax=Allomesorhizobium camelthorni TaxID=475069 RepID=A0A6G4W9R3_9HYPH|nr:DUF86 domain-containing protein [Mesorhizobium camelthorni]